MVNGLGVRYMADNNLEFKVTAKADGEELLDLAKNFEKLKEDASEPIEVKAKFDDGSISEYEKEINDLNGKQLLFETDIDSVPLENVGKIISDLDGEKVDIKIQADDNEVKSAKMEVTDLNGEKVSVDIDIDDSTLKSVRKEIDDLQGENVSINIDVDDSQLKTAKSEADSLGDSVQSSMSNLDSAVTGVISGMAGKSIWDTIYGTSAKAETNKILIKNMGDTSKAWEDMYNTVDQTTDGSLISMQQLIPAINGIKAATGASASTIDSVTPGVASFGQYVYALSGSSAKAEQAMFDLSKGIKGAYASLDQYGITEDALMRTGLWSGKEDDLEGYIAAVNEVTGDTSELMGTATGLEAQLGKAFSRAGKHIGNDLLPYLEGAMNGFLDLDDATDGWLSTIGLIGSGTISGMITVASGLQQLKGGYDALRAAYALLIPEEYAEGVAGWFSIGWLVVAIALGIALGLALIYLYNHSETFRNAVNALGEALQGLASGILGAVTSAINWLSSLFTNFTNQLGLNTNDWTQAILAFILFLPTLPIQLSVAFVNAIAKTLGFGNNFVQTLTSAASRGVSGFINSIKGMYDSLVAELQAMLKAAEDYMMRIADTMTWGGASMVTGYQYGTNERSPGDMYDMFTGELTAMEDQAENYSSRLNEAMSRFGKGLVSNFGDPQLNLGVNTNADFINGTITGTPKNDSPNIVNNITVEVGTVDNEDRVNEIVDAVRRSLAWDNKTAGRSV